MLIGCLLIGKTINLTSDNIAIASNNFRVDTNGNMTCSNANITGGTLNIGAETTASIINIHSTDRTTNKLIGTNISASGYGVYCNSSDMGNLISIGLAIGDYFHSTIRMLNEGDSDETKLYAGGVNFWENNLHTYVGGTGITTPNVTQTSLESVKKNISNYDENATEVIKNSKIYSYNLKNEDDTDKKHIGFVIPDLGGNYITPQEVIAKSGEGIDTYTMCSILWKAIQEQQELIDGLNNEIKILKGEQ